MRRTDKNIKKIIYITEDADFLRKRHLLEAEDFDDNDFVDEDDDFMDESMDESMDELNEDSNDGPDNNDGPEPPMDEEKLRIESLKIATNVAKLMDNVTPDDIVKIAGMVAEFIRNNNTPTNVEESTDDFEDGSDIDTDTDEFVDFEA